MTRHTLTAALSHWLAAFALACGSGAEDDQAGGDSVAPAADTAGATDVGDGATAGPDVPSSPDADGGAMPAPSAPGVADDDASWLCQNRPEAPREGDSGLFVAGITECYRGGQPPVPGRDIWASPAGGGAGMAADDPLGLADALCRAEAGQTVHLLPGIYREGVALALFGDARGPALTIRGEPRDGAPVVLDGEHWRTFGIGLVESANIVIERIELRHYTDGGVWVLLGQDMIFRDLVIRSNGRCSVDPDAEGEGFGINLVGLEGYLVEDCVFVDNGPLRAVALAGEALGTGVNTYEASGTIRNNHIHGNRGGGVLIEQGHDALVEGNLIEANWLLAIDNYWDGAIWVDGSRDIELVGNTVRNNYGGAGIMVTDEEGSFPDRSVRTSLAGNTVEGHLAGVLAWGFGACPPPAGAILDYDTLEMRNTLRDNTFGGVARDVWCDPMFVGGTRP